MDRKSIILQVALSLFSNNGYNSVSTKKIAIAANVSEGLIFKHYGNKEGLLKAILENGSHQLAESVNKILNESDPRKAIALAISLSFEVGTDAYEYWRLIYALKWQTNKYDASFMQPMKEKLAWAFGQLDYPNPKSEADIIWIIMDGTATSLILHEPTNKIEILNTLLIKYNLAQ